MVTAVYVPLFALSGMEGRLFTPIGVTYILSLAASLVVALTVTPVMCYLLIPNSRAITEPREPRLVKRLKGLASRFIDISLAHQHRILSVLFGLMLIFGVAISAHGP